MEQKKNQIKQWFEYYQIEQLHTLNWICNMKEIIHSYDYQFEMCERRLLEIFIVEIWLPIWKR